MVKMDISTNKLVREETYYAKICKLLLDKHNVSCEDAGSLLHELIDIMEQEYSHGVTDASTESVPKSVPESMQLVECDLDQEDF